MSASRTFRTSELKKFAGLSLASALLLDRRMQKKQLKILAEVPRFDGNGTYMLKVGTAFTNRDDSINGFIESLPLAALSPKGFKIHIRELDARDLEKREAYRTAATGRTLEPPASAASEPLPF